MNSDFSLALDDTLDRQKKRWLKGERPRVHDLLRDSSLPTTPDTLLDLIYNEIVVREELGETPSLDEYVHEFPAIADELRLHFEVHQAVHEELINTQLTGESTPLDDGGIRVDVGPILADYEIEGELGRGGMGAVYKARHRRLKRLVALKMFHPGRTPSPRELVRFRDEAESIARLHHPNIIQIFEVGQDAGRPYLSLELAEKGTLQQRLMDLPYSPHDAAELVETISRAVQHAHDRQIVHRDLKPANVLFVEGDAKCDAKSDTPKLTDFGLAKLLATDEDAVHDVTRTGEPIGTPRYMSPEQASGRTGDVGPATDIYALGTILYECLTGRPPFLAATVAETVDKIRHELPLSPRRLVPSTPRDLETICLCCLEKDPQRRYRSATMLADDLRRFRSGEPIRARRTPLWRRGAMWARRHPAAATGIAAAVLFAASIGAALFVSDQMEQRRVAALRATVDARMGEGHNALQRGDARTAREHFRTALATVQHEPTLGDQVLTIRGWLDHSSRGADERIRLQREPPPLFEERCDEATLLCLLADPAQPSSLRAAGDVIEDVKEFINPDDPAWRMDREWIALLEANVAQRRGDAAAALVALDRAQPLASRRAAEQRAEILARLGRTAEAAEQRVQSNKLAINPVLDPLYDGIVHAQSGDPHAAIADFDRALAADPRCHAARVLQGICFLRDHRTNEAKVALTACIGQYGRSPWGYVFRGQALIEGSNLLAAAQDLQTAAEKTKGSPLQELDNAVQAFGLALASLPRDRQDSIWNAEVVTNAGPQPIRALELFTGLKKE